MKIAIPVLLAISFSAAAEDVSVRGYYRQNGTYVAPSHRSAPDHNPNNNYSSFGNSNPYTGAIGTEPYRAPTFQPAPAYTPPPTYTPPQVYQPYAPPRPQRPYGY